MVSVTNSYIWATKKTYVGSSSDFVWLATFPTVLIPLLVFAFNMCYQLKYVVDDTS